MSDSPTTATALTVQQNSRPKKKTGGTRQRRGCLTCRQRKKRCDGIHSTCGHCQRLNLVCQWERPCALTIDQGVLSPNRAPTVLAIQQRSSSILKAPDPMLFWVEDKGSGVHTLERRLVLRYYMQTFTKILTTNLDNNGFLSVLLPMAIESPSVLDTLIAWSSSHLSLCHESYQVRALEDRSSALASFASSISTNGLSPELSLAGCLILCSMEAILGDTSDWYEHLVGAAQIIRSTNVDSTGRRGMETLSRTLEGRWLLRNFAYHDILMSVTLDCEPLIAGPYWISDNENVNVVDSYFGLATQPMRLLSTISFLNADMLGCSLYLYSDDSSFPPTLNGYQDDGFFNGDRNLPFKVFSSRAFRIESQLQEWVCVESPDRSLMSLAETYRSAALIHLYRTIRRHFPAMTVILNKKIALQVDAIVQHVGDMPPECLPECTLLFPLFMAGGEADCESHIRYIRQRMLDLAAFRRFHNVDAALSVLEELWRLKASTMPIDGQRVVDWSEITERRGWKLALS